MADMQSLSFDISADSSKAVQGLDSLVTSLNSLKSAASNGASSLGKIATNVSTLSRSLNSLNNVSAAKISSIGQSLTSLKSISLTKTTADNVASLSKSLSTLSNLSSLGSIASNLKTISSALQGLKSTGSSLKTLFKRLNELPEIVKQFANVDISGFTQQLTALANALTPLATQMATVGTGFSNLANNITSATSKMSSAASKTESATSSTNKLGIAAMGTSQCLNSAVSSIAKFGVRTLIMSGALTSAIDQSNKYQEDLNLFTVAMGNSASKAQEFAEKVGAAVGIDPAEWMRNQGVFNTLLEGFGVASDKAEVMSQNMTQLGYDLASFYNISTSDALQKIQSGISGELEPLRRLGYDLSVARLQQEAYSLGINESVSSMTQAEKAQLRYHAIMTQVTAAQGDMARTINAPANQLRVLQAQFTLCARAIGNIFIPMLNAILPIAIAVVKAIRMVASAIASLFGFKLTKVNYDGVSVSASKAATNTSDLGDSTASSGKKAAKAAKQLKKYNKQLLGFDQINNLTTTSSSSGGSSGSSGTGSSGTGTGDLGGGFDLEPESYDFLDGLQEYIGEKYKWITSIGTFLSKHVKGVVSILASAIGGFLAVFVTTKISKFAKVLRTCFGASWFKTAAGLFLTVSGAIKTFISVVDMWKNGVTGGGIIQFLVGLGEMATGIGLLTGKLKATGITVLLGGLLLVIESIADIMKNGLSYDNFTGLAAGIALITGALIALNVVSGPIGWITLAIAGVAAVLAFLIKRCKPVRKAFETLVEAVKHPLKTIQDLWKKFKKWLGKHFSMKDTLGKNSLFEGLANLFKHPIKTLKKQWNSFMKWFAGTKLGGIVQTIGAGIGKLVDFFKHPIENIKILWRSFIIWFKGNHRGLAKAVEVGFQVFKTIVAFVRDPIGTVKRLWNTFVKWFKNTFPGLSKKIEMLKTAFDKIVGFVKHPIKTVKKLWKKFKKWIANKFNPANWFGGGNDSGKSGKKSSKKLSKNLKKTLKDSLKNIDGKKLLTDIASTWFKAVTFPIQIAFDIGDKINDAIAGVTGIDVKATFGGWADDASKLWDRFQVDVGQVWSIVKSKFSEWAEGAKEKWSNFKEGVGEVWSNVEAKCGEWAEGAKEKWGNFKEGIGNVAKQVEAKCGEWAEGAKEKWGNFKEGIGNVAKQVEAKCGEWAEGAKKKWGNFKEDIGNVAKQVEAKSGGWAAGASKKWSSFTSKIKDKTVTITAKIKTIWSGIKKKVKKLLGFANGGFPSTGQMFVAREAGPEMVGKIGTKSAVVNNSQIEGAIARSVSSGNLTQNMLLRQLISAVNAGNNQSKGSAEVKLVVDGQTFGKAAIKNINKVQRQQGRTLLEV